MRWRDFLNKRQAYKKAWEELKESYTGDIRQFLNSSHLVVAYGANMAGQFDIKHRDPAGIAMENPDFFVKDSHGSKLIELVQQYKAVKDQNTDLKSKIMKQLQGVDTEFLTVVENQAEVRFPTLNIDFIQEVKKSNHCDKKATSMSKGSIRIILKTSG
jgi:hypothetical protein